MSEPVKPKSIPAHLVYPLNQKATADYTTGARRFGSGRKGGRKHAGIDLYAPVGTPVMAMAAGKIIQPVYSFYLGTYALEVDHGTFVARYGEIQRDLADKFKTGDEVTAGQRLGQVGQLQGLSFSMLHLELYSGAEKGGLTVRSNLPYKRRKDLMDPTPFVDQASLPQA